MGITALTLDLMGYTLIIELPDRLNKIFSN